MLIWLLSLASAAQAHDPRCDSVKTDDLVACTAAESDQANAALNAQWKAMRHPDDLVRAQRAWLAWRDAECKAQNYAKEGREGPIVAAACTAALTEQRTKQLRDDYRWMGR